ncbi:MAG: hypothetical protein M5U14_05155 [Acidimicrobiia bacterium]|nr:hypothetical protein [Acidimicrobiia bacterium]
MRTIDGKAYDLQSVGEFVAARSSGGHEIQLRTAPLGTSRRVSVGAAVAADVAGTVVSMRSRPDGIDLHIDGEAVDVARGDFVAVGDQGALVSTGEAVMVVWPDGSQLNVHRRGLFIDVRFFPVDDDSLAWEGLFGDSDGDRTNDLRLADGTALEDATFDDIHGQFADSWRVTDDTSLFHYDDGETTATYTDRSFPEVRTTAGDLDPDALAAARATCIAYGIVDEAALADCAYDLAITDDLVFLRSAGMLQDSTFEGRDGSATFDGDVRTASTVQDRTITGEIREPGDVERHDFEARAGDRVWITVDEVNGDCANDPDEHLGWELLSPDGKRVDSFGDIRGCPERGPIALEAGGTWTLEVSAGENDPSTGTYQLRLRGVQGDDEAQTSMGATVRGEIESVGVSDFHRFEAGAGDRMWITVGEVNGDCANDPDEHLGWNLLSPDGGAGRFVRRHPRVSGPGADRVGGRRDLDVGGLSGRERSVDGDLRASSDRRARRRPGTDVDRCDRAGRDRVRGRVGSLRVRCVGR